MSSAKAELMKFAKQKPEPKAVPGVNKVILVASGKGGVGKSTVATNLAIALSEQGHRVGLLDTDIYGPSIPKMMGIGRKPVLEDNLMVPHEKYGLKLMSVGFLVDENVATVWRGPMTTKTLYQLINMTKWADKKGNLDYLIVDTPPGTGDVHLSLAENYKIDGVVAVSTPQEIALADARKAVDMYGKLNIPVLGIIENMSCFVDPKSGNKTHIFGKDGAKKLAKKHKVPFLGEIPVEPDLVEASDKGKPITYKKNSHDISLIFMELARSLVSQA